MAQQSHSFSPSPRSDGVSVASDADSEASLIARACQGDDRAFEVLMRRHNQLLFRTARSVLHNDADAEDALQEAYLHAWRALARFRQDSRLSTWLVRIVLHEAIGRVRRPSAQIIPLDSAIELSAQNGDGSMDEDSAREPEALAANAEMRGLIESRIDRLPDLYRTVFMLRAVQELSVEDVAQALQLPEATVRTRYFRARSLLREGLSRDLDLAVGDAFGFDGARCDRIVAGTLQRIAHERQFPHV